MGTWDGNSGGEIRDDSIVLPVKEVTAALVGSGSGACPSPGNSPWLGDDYALATEEGEESRLSLPY
jgi:hypothetical protein